MKPWTLCFSCLVAAAAYAQQTAPAPATGPATSPATATAPAIDPAVLKILADLEAAGNHYRALRSDLSMEINDRLTGDSERRTGWVAYQKVSDQEAPRFRVHFDTLKQGAGPVVKEQLDYAFDGKMLTVAKHRIKDMVRYQVVAEGETAEPMRLGKGPFPLPFGQKARDVVEHFQAETRPLEPGGPEGTIYLKLTTRPKHAEDVEFVEAELWIDPKTNLPVQLRSRDRNKKVTTAVFDNLRTDVEIDAEKTFHMPRPMGWTYKVERLEK